jgi:hypothetical protein
MDDREIRAALERNWETLSAGDQALRSQHPARPSGFVVRRIVGGGDQMSLKHQLVVVVSAALADR